MITMRINGKLYSGQSVYECLSKANITANTNTTLGELERKKYV